MTREHDLGKEASYGRLARLGGAWSAWRLGLSMAIHVPAAMITARLLSPTEFGIAAVSTMVVRFGYRLTQLGLNQALVRVKDLRREHETSMFVFNLGIGVVAYLSLVLLAPWVGRFFDSPESGYLIPLGGVVFLISPFGTVPGALLVRHFRFREVAGLAFIDNLVGVGTTIGLAWAGFSYWSLPSGVLAGGAVAAVRRHYLSGWKIGFGFSWPAFRELVSYGSGVQTKRLIAYGANNLDTVIVGKLLGVTLLGFYDKAFGTMGRLTSTMGFGAGVTFRILATIADQPERFRRAFQKTMTVAVILVVPALTACGVMAHEFFHAAFGARWVPSAPVFQFLCLSGACRVLTGYVGNANEAVGRIWMQAGGQAVSLVVMVISVFVGASLFGVVGAGAGMALSAILDLLLALGLLIRSTTLSWKDVLLPFRLAAYCIAGLAPTILLARRAVLLTGHSGPWMLLVSESLAGLVFLAAFAVWCPDPLYRAVAADFVEDAPSRLPARVRTWLARRFPQVKVA